MSGSGFPTRLTSRDWLIRAARRWTPLVILAAAIAGAMAFGISRAIQPEYLATAQLYIAPASNPTVAFQDVVLGTNVARSYVQLISSEVVLRPAMAKVGWTDVNSFADRLRAAQVPNTSIITVSFQASDPQVAADAANAVADSFIAQTRQLQDALQGTTVAQLQTQIDSVTADIKTLDQQISALRADLAVTPKPGQTTSPTRADDQALLAQLDSSRQSKQQTLAQLLKTRDDMNLSNVRAESTVSLWQPAVPPDRPVTPRVGLNTALGVLAGGLISLIGVLLIAFYDDRLADLEDVQDQLGIPALGLVHLSDHPDTLKGKLFVRDATQSHEAEAFRSLRTNIQFANVDRPIRRIVVTSALPREGKSVVSANLAIAFAQAGSKTILIDADLRRPSQHRLFGVSVNIGLTNFLTDPTAVRDLERFRVGPGLMVIPSGSLPPNPAELLSSSRMSAFLNELGRSVPDLVMIIDTSPVLAAADAVALSTKVDATILVVDSARTHARAAARAIDVMRRVNASIIGVVLNKISAKRTAYYYTGEYYGPASRPAPPASRR